MGIMHIHCFNCIIVIFHFTVHTVPSFMVTTTLEPHTSQPRVGMSVDIVCTVSTGSGVESNLVSIIWTGPGGGSGGGSGGGAIINDSRVSIGSTTSSGNNYTSSVQFSYLMEGDEGTYTCNVMILDTSGSSSYILPSLISKLALCILLKYKMSHI